MRCLHTSCLLAVLLMFALAVPAAAQHSIPHPSDGYWENCGACHNVSGTSATLRVNISRPDIRTNEDVFTVRAFQDRIAQETLEITAREAGLHPAKDVPCAACHLTGDLGGPFHTDRIMDESDPDATCGAGIGCHSLATAMRMPWWVEPNVQLARRGNVFEGAQEKTEALFAYADSLTGELPERLQGVPPFRRLGVDLEVSGSSADRQIGRGWENSFEHRPSAPLPQELLEALAPQVLARTTAAQAAIGGQPTALSARFDAKVNRARVLGKHLETFRAMPLSIAGLLSRTYARLSYSGHSLSEAAMADVAERVLLLFPGAEQTRDDADRKQWTVPGDPVTSIDLRTTRITFTNAPQERYPEIFRMFEEIQRDYPDIPTNYARFYWTYAAETAADKALLAQELAAFNSLSQSGDLKLDLNLTAGEGELPTATTDIADPASNLIQLHPANIRKLKAEFRYGADLQPSSAGTETVTTRFSDPTDVDRNGLIDRGDYDAARANYRQTGGRFGRYDINDNGRVDAGDLRAIFRTFECPRGICE